MLCLKDLKYRGEGNNNIALANNKGLIYRVRKTSLPALLPTKKTRAFKKSQQLTVLFGQNRMVQYFGPNFIQPLKLLSVNSSVLQAINDRFESYRPAFRRNRGVDLQADHVLVTPDATCIPASLMPYGEGPVLCVEIKPKFGAIPRGVECNPVDVAVRRNCMFGIMQYYETKRRMWGRPSSYCPCDIFSGNVERMFRALFAMLEVRQNNLRVFLDSCCVLNDTLDELDSALADFFLYPTTKEGEGGDSSGDSVEFTPPLVPEESSCDSDWEGGTAYSLSSCPLHPTATVSLRHHLLEGLLFPGLLAEIPSPGTSGSITRPSNFRYECDLHPFISTTPNGSAMSKSAGSISSLCFPDLLQNSPLGRIFKAQLESSLSHGDLIKHYESVASYFGEHDISWDAYIGGKVTVNTVEAPTNVVESLNLVEKHLVAMVARDCSVMLTFQRAKKSCPSNVLTVGGGCPCVPRIIINTSIVDLDPKQLSNLQERVESERRVVEQFLCRHIN